VAENDAECTDEGRPGSSSSSFSSSGVTLKLLDTATGRVVCADLMRTAERASDQIYAYCSEDVNPAGWSLGARAFDPGETVGEFCRGSATSLLRTLPLLRAAEKAFRKRRTKRQPERGWVRLFGGVDEARPWVAYRVATVTPPEPEAAPYLMLLEATLTPAVSDARALEGAVRFLADLARRHPYAGTRLAVEVPTARRVAPLLRERWVRTATLPRFEAGFLPGAVNEIVDEGLEFLLPLLAARTANERRALLRRTEKILAGNREPSFLDALWATETWEHRRLDDLLREQEWSPDFGAVRLLLSSGGWNLNFASGRPKTTMLIFSTPGGPQRWLPYAELDARQARAVEEGKAFDIWLERGAYARGKGDDLGGDDVRGSDARVDASELVPLYMIPVSRYAGGMSRGLFYDQEEDDGAAEKESGEPGEERFCGTFYYVEPGSDVLLDMGEGGRFLTAHNKLSAAVVLNAELAKRFAGREMPEDLAALSVEIDEGVHRLVSAHRNDGILFRPGSRLNDEQRYTATLRFLVGALSPKTRIDPASYRLYDESGEPLLYVGDTFYAQEDVFDQPLCRLARRLGYAAVVLLHMPSALRVVSEVLDVRPRAESFANLVHILS